MQIDRLKRRIVAVAGAVSLFVAIASPAQARVVHRESWEGAGTDTVDCGDFELDHSWTAQGRLLIKGGRGGEPSLYFMDKLRTHSVFTNPVGGRWFTVDQHSLLADTKITSIGGNLIQIEWILAGQPFVVRDMAGKVVSRDVGRVLQSIVVDHMGTPDVPDDDVAIEDSYQLLAVNGPHPQIAKDFCDIVRELDLA